MTEPNEWDHQLRQTEAEYEAGLEQMLRDGDLDFEGYQRCLHHNATCYLCKKRLPGGVNDIVETDERIGFQPELKHVKEMLEGVVPQNPYETYGQGDTMMHGTDAIVCHECLDKIAEAERREH